MTKVSTINNGIVEDLTTTAGSLYYAPTANTLGSIAAGTDGYTLQMVAGTPAWGASETATTGVFTNTSNQLVLGTTTTTTLNASAPASSAVYTIPDVGTTGSFILTTGAQTMSGAKTFSAAIAVTAATNQIALGATGHIVTINSPAIVAAAQTITLPDALGASTFGLKVAVPASASAAGTVGTWACDASYLYICQATNTWLRVAIATW